MKQRAWGQPLAGVGVCVALELYMCASSFVVYQQAARHIGIPVLGAGDALALDEGPHRIRLLFEGHPTLAVLRG